MVTESRPRSHNNRCLSQQGSYVFQPPRPPSLPILLHAVWEDADRGRGDQHLRPRVTFWLRSLSASLFWRDCKPQTGRVLFLLLDGRQKHLGSIFRALVLLSYTHGWKGFTGLRLLVQNSQLVGRRMEKRLASPNLMAKRTSRLEWMYETAWRHQLFCWTKPDV